MTFDAFLYNVSSKTTLVKFLNFFVDYTDEIISARIAASSN